VKPFNQIFALVPDCHVPGGAYSDLWRRHFYEGLQGCVPRVHLPKNVDFSWARGSSNEGITEQRAATSSRILEQIRAAHPTVGIDAVISYCFAGDIEIELVKETIRLGIPWINFYCDSTHRFSEVEPLAKVATLNWFPEHAAIPRYRAIGANSACLPYAMNPVYLPDLTCEQPENAVVFIGFPSANRITQLGWLSLFGCRVMIRGRGWLGEGPFQSAIPKGRRFWSAFKKFDLGEKLLRRILWRRIRGQVGGALSPTEFEGVLRKSQIVLGLNQGKDELGRFMSYLKFRDIEFPGYGCCYLTEANPDLGEAFQLGKEILAASTMREAARTIRSLLKNPKAAREIGQAGRGRVLRSHTWTERLRQLQEHL